MFNLRPFCKCGSLWFAIWRPKLFEGLKLPQVRRYKLFLQTNLAYNALIQICEKYKKMLKRQGAPSLLTHSCAVFADLRNYHKNLRFCDLQTCTPKNYADLRHRNETKNFWIRDLLAYLCNLHTVLYILYRTSDKKSSTPAQLLWLYGYRQKADITRIGVESRGQIHKCAYTVLYCT
jgi:hypothetical protein